MTKISPWRLAAIQAIDGAIANALPGTDLKQAIDAAYPFGTRENLPYKMWLEEGQKVLIRLGLYQLPQNRKCKYHPDGQTCLMCMNGSLVSE